ncbi:MAG TPA: ATP-binding cassette domain-containing protein [Clostridia bacterium]|nr:ATP-binding cassette domain-containing protein [Clostridia bacterium]
MRDLAVKIRDLSFTYYRGKNAALDGINLEVEKGEFIAIMGATGSGKTTLCLCMNGIIPHFMFGSLSGTVEVAGMSTVDHFIDELSEKVGMVLQDPESQLFSATVLTEVAFGAENLGLPREEIRERIDWALEVVRLKGLEHRSPRELSGGQKQRLAIASALVMRPEILVLDEPTSELDPIGTKDVFSTVKRLNREFGITVVMVEHKSEEVAVHADRVVILKSGKIIFQGTPREVFSNPDVVAESKILCPPVVDFGFALRRGGYELKEIPISEDEAFSIARSIMGKRGLTA